MDYGFYHGFKIGNWAQNIRTKKVLFKITQIDYAIDHIQGYINNKPAFHSMSKCKVWHPQQDEYCWFLTCNSGYELGQFVRLLENGNFQYRLNMTNSLFNCSSCEPFFGTLPSFLQ